MGTRLEGTTGGDGLRHGFREETRYAWPAHLHAGAAALAATCPLLATMMILCTALLAA